MTCCSDSNCKTSHPTKQKCPVDGNECAEVSTRTIAHHIKQSWLWNPNGQRYYFCDDPNCDIVYFGEDGSKILKSELRIQVGAKETNENAMLCYCFEVTQVDVLNNPSIKDFIVEQTKRGQCSCETSNPSGRCCLKDFPHL